MALPVEEKGLTAEELQKEFKEHSVADFFKKNKQMLGLSGKIKTMTTIIHEYVTNSLDACEESRVLPDLEVRIVVWEHAHGRVCRRLGCERSQAVEGTQDLRDVPEDAQRLSFAQVAVEEGDVRRKARKRKKAQRAAPTGRRAFGCV